MPGQPALPPQPPQPPVLVPQALEMLRNDLKRSFGIDIETDSTIQPDEQAEKEARVEMLTGVTGFMQQALPAAQLAPELVPMIGEFLLFTVRTFKAGRQLEATIEEMVDQARNNPPQPKEDPQVAADKAKLELEAKKAQQDGQIRQAEMQQKAQLAEREFQLKAQMAEKEFALKERQMMVDAQLKQQSAANDMQLKQRDADANAQIKRQTAENDMQVKRETAQAAKKPQVALQMTDDKQFQELRGELSASTKGVQAAVQAMAKSQADSAKVLAQAAQTIAQAAAQISAPKPKRRLWVVRDGAGMIEGAEED